MPLSVANSTRQKPRYSPGGVNEDTWAGHAADHDALAAATGGVASVVYVIGAEAGNAINVGVQLVDVAGTNVAELAAVTAYLSDDIDGIGISAGAPSAGVAIGTDGAILVAHTADLGWLLQSEADGDIDIDINHVGAATWYLVVILPNGTLAVSAPITFT